MMQSVRSSKPGRQLLLVMLLPTVFFVTYAFVNFHRFVQPCDEMSDSAVLSLQIIRARHFQELLGPYSRWGFNHPGPAAFYYFALAESFLPDLEPEYARHRLAQLILNYALLSCAVYGISILTKSRFSAVVFFFCVLLSLNGVGPGVYLGNWNAWAVILPALMVVVGGSLIAEGRLTFLPVTVISTVLAAHNHLSATTVVTPVFAVALFLCCRSRAQSPARLSVSERAAMVISVVIGLFGIGVPVFEELTAKDGGNLSKILSFTAGQHGGAQHSAAEAIRFILGYYSAPFRSLVSINPFLVAAILALLVLLFVVRGTHAARLRNMLLLTGVGIGLSALTAMNMRGDLMDYLMTIEFAFVAVVFFGAFSGLFSLLPSSWSVSAPIRNGLFAGVLLAVPLLTWYTHRLEVPEYDDRVSVLFQELQRHPAPGWKVIINEGAHHEQWPLAAGLILKMVRNDCRVCVSEDWVFMFGKSLRCPPDKTFTPVHFFLDRAAPPVSLEHSFSYKGTRIDFGQRKP